MDPFQIPPADPPGLRRRLKWHQIFMICIGGTIGLGFAKKSGEVLAIAGPGGTLIAFGVVGIVAICVMEGVCEMIVLWPISNAMIEFVREFVDPDLAVVVGFTYWYTYCCGFAALVVGGADLLDYFEINNILLNVVYVLCMLTLFIINCLSVSIFGAIEFWGGVLKLLIIGGIFILMMCINGGVGSASNIGGTIFEDAVRNNPNVASSHFVAVLIVIPLAMFAYIGVELVTVTAFEAATPHDLQRPAKNIAYVILVIYMITIGGITANVEWFNQNLPTFSFESLVSPNDTDLGHTPLFPQATYLTSAAPVIAVLQAGYSKALPAILIVLLIYSGLSCANVNLYVGSRTFYGLTRDLDYGSKNWFESFFAHLNVITPKSRVPIWSVIASIVIFASWLPFVHLYPGYGTEDLFQTMTEIGSVGCLLVWASQCLAFIRYNQWLFMHRQELTGEHYGKFQRWPVIEGFSSYAAALQPIPAYIGLVACLAIVFILSSASMFNGNQLLFKGLNIYLAPAMSLILFIILKIINPRGWVKLNDNWSVLHETLDRLNSLIEHNTFMNGDGISNVHPTTRAFSSPDNDVASSSDYLKPSLRQPMENTHGMLPTDQQLSPMYNNAYHDPIRRSIPYSTINEAEGDPRPTYFTPSPMSAYGSGDQFMRHQ